MPTTPRLHPVLIHTAHLPQVEALLADHGYHLQPVQDIRHGHAHILTRRDRRPRDTRP